MFRRTKDDRAVLPATARRVVVWRLSTYQTCPYPVVEITEWSDGTWAVTRKDHTHD
jgi:hypothetical protein